MKVIKRDGSTADFDSSKIIVAIQKANQVVEPEDRICLLYTSDAADEL